MCLYIRDRRAPVIATEDIEAYKVVRVNSSGHFYSPYMFFHYELGGEYTSELFKRERSVGFVSGWLNGTFDDLCDVSDGVSMVEYGLHTFANKEDAIHFFELRQDVAKRCGKSLYKILKCVIPAGSQLYIGKWDYTATALVVDSGLHVVDAYASNRLNVIEIIEEVV